MAFITVRGDCNHGSRILAQTEVSELDGGSCVPRPRGYPVDSTGTKKKRKVEGWGRPFGNR